ncbi:hypothetical protein X474_10675 [Dethiosulfatarculus sandiegensis]|uniref:Uncharacterized protein n=1 Tax=Dethiosulfatarculus sandiegensis TaxID=1429043 RepID=A0A0D2JWZ5_9BACT|nr:hypothetical protein X474_10675 [Dethiosulfatarculus sandiegensis]
MNDRDGAFGANLRLFLLNPSWFCTPFLRKPLSTFSRRRLRFEIIPESLLAFHFVNPSWARLL